VSAFVSVEELRLELGGVPVLDDLSFSVAEGESVALTGPNGSGKTSILRCLLGLAPFRGRATVGGHDVERAPIAARTLCGYLPQKPAFGDARADEALLFVARLRRIERSRVARVLETVGLSAHAHASARTFSGGMQQRLSLAMALLTDAPLLLFDEPTASLDREGQATFVEVVRDLRRSGRTLLLASHRPEEIYALTDRVLVLDRGRLAGETASRAPSNVVPLCAARERR
jgi:ABC-type multidrug transport system ATPase subunit